MHVLIYIMKYINLIIHCWRSIVNSYIEFNNTVHCWRDEFSNNAVFHNLPLRSPTIFLKKL